MLRALTTLVALALCTGCPTPTTQDAGVDSGSGVDSGAAVDAGNDAGAVDAATADAGLYPPLDAVAKAELTRLVTRLASDEFDGRNEGTLGSTKARAYIIEQLTACGVKDAGTAGFEQSLSPYVGTNILGRIDGTDVALRDRVVLVSAHYDHLGNCSGAICNGAGDNAAGVAEIIAVGCALAHFPPRRSVVIASWDAEEPITFLTAGMGSEFYAAHPVIPLANIDAALVLDLAGLGLWSGYAGHFLLGAEKSPQVAAAVDAALTDLPSLPSLKPARAGLHLAEETLGGHQPWSDYDAFRNRSVPFLFISDGQNVHYHTASDEVVHLDLDKLASEARLLLDITWRLGNAQATPTFDAAGASHLRDANAVIDLLESALATNGVIDTLQLTAATRTKLETDLSASRTVQTRAAQGTPPSSQDIRVLRTAIQRVMCHSSGGYSEVFCNAL